MGIDAHPYTTPNGLHIGTHTIVGVEFEGKFYLLDPTISQYSRFNLPLITSMDAVIAHTNASDKWFEHFAMDGYEGLLVGKRYRDRPVKEANAMLEPTEVVDIKHKPYIEKMMKQFDTSAKEGKFPRWQPIIESDRNLPLEEEHLEKVFTFESAKKLATKSGDSHRFGALFDLGHRYAGQKDSQETLFAALDDSRPEIRFVAALSLRQGIDAKTQPKLTDLSAHDPDPDVRNAAQYTLGKLSFKKGPEFEFALMPGLAASIDRKALPALTEKILTETHRVQAETWAKYFEFWRRAEPSPVLNAIFHDSLRRGYGE